MKMKYQNNQLYCECQLVALWNAARFYGINDIPQMGTQLYDDICDKGCCVYGGCININHEWDRLNLKAIRGTMNLRWVKKNIPVHFAVFCHRGYHSVLAVKVVKNKITLANYARNRLHTIDWNILKSKHNKNVKPFAIKLR